MLTVWGRRSSSNVQAVMWCIGELDLPHQRHDAGFTYGVTNTPEFLAMNPNATVPVLEDRGSGPIWETGAILRYLGSKYGVGPFWPEDPAARAQVDKWAEWAKLNIAQVFTRGIFWQLVRTPAKDRDMAGIKAALAELGKYLAIAERQIERHGFLAGEELTLADIQFGHALYRYYDVAIAHPDLPAIRTYYDELTERAAFREHVMVAYDELRVT